MSCNQCFHRKLTEFLCCFQDVSCVLSKIVSSIKYFLTAGSVFVTSQPRCIMDRAVPTPWASEASVWIRFANRRHFHSCSTQRHSLQMRRQHFYIAIWFAAWRRSFLWRNKTEFGIPLCDRQEFFCIETYISWVAISSFRMCCQEERFSSRDVMSVWLEDDWSLESDAMYMRNRIYFLSRCFWGNCIPLTAKFSFVGSPHY
jgi:hypothetical protein